MGADISGGQGSADLTALVFPQLSSGALAQFPIQTKRLKRTILNQAEDGSRIVLADMNQSTIEWGLRYSGLSDAEAASLSQFFQSTEGSLQTFLFVDPTSNLLAQSETLNQTVWQENALLTTQGNISDPLGTNRATRIVNTSAGALTLAQTLSIPSTLICCFSVYLRSGQATNVTLSRTSGGNSAASTVAIASAWQRKLLVGTVLNGGTSCVFAVAIPAGLSVDVFGLQVDAQSAASQYVQTNAQSGVYANARFQSDVLTITADGPNRNSCALSIVTNG